MPKRRTRDEIKIEILEELYENDGGLRATTIANAVGVNFVPGREILREMETVDRTIIRGTDKLYVIRESGKITLKKATMENKDIVRIIELAREVTHRQPMVKEFASVAGHFESDDGICIYCGVVGGGHTINCSWNELRRLVNQ